MKSRCVYEKSINDNNGFFIKEELPVLDEEDENADID